MASARTRSSKRSATSSSSPPERPALFIDRDAWSRVLGERLTEARVAFVAHRDVFRPDGADVEWIAAVSSNGWLAVTRDQNIRRKPNEIEAIRQSRALVFVFTSGNLSATDTASLLLKALPRMYRASEAERRPALYSIRKDGSIAPLKL
jgi:hypothetical protein